MNKSTTTKPMQASSNNPTGTNESIVDEAKQTAAHVASQAKEGVSQQIGHRKEKAVEKIETVSSALRDASGKLEGTGPLPDLAEKAAEGIDRLAHYFETRDVNDMVRGVERFARREPALFLGGALAVGVIAGRFLKSSSRRMDDVGAQGGRYSDVDARDTYETYGYEGDYGDDYLGADDLEENWDVSDEPLGFQSEDRGIGTSAGGGIEPTPGASTPPTAGQGTTTGPGTIGGGDVGPGERPTEPGRRDG